MRVTLILAALLTAGAATAATATPPGGGPCHVYFRDPAVQHNIDGVPGIPGTPYLYCDY